MKYNYIIAILAVLGGFGLQDAAAQSVRIDSLEFDKALATTPATMLGGKVSGIRVSATDGNINGLVNTYIRGVNSLRGDSQPLWIVDGVMVNSSLSENNDAFFQYPGESYTSPLNALSYINPYDIESIEVIKDLSATAIYGSKGANGVIIVNTKLPKSGAFNISWNSNIGFSGSDALGSTTFPDICEVPGFSHNHTISLNGAVGQTKYNVSAFFRNHEGVLDGNRNRVGGIRAQFDTHANKVVWFGMDATFTMGDLSSVAGVSYYGKPSLTLGMRKDGFFPGDSKDGWAADYSDDAHERRGTASTYVTFNFTPNFRLKAAVNMDIENNNRYIWYGNGTSFGKANNGAASLLGTTVFKYGGKVDLRWSRYFNNDHHITLNGGIEATGDMTKYNTINGNDFFTHVLRAKGISIAASKKVVHKYDHDYFTCGVFAEASYSYKDFVGVNAIVRGDNTPRYDDKHFNLYKGFSAFFDIHDAFFADGRTVSALRIKGGYGEAGREQYVPYGMYGSYVPGPYPAIDRKFESFYEGFNRLKSSETNIGIELGLFENRVLLGAGFYDKKSVDTFDSYCFGELGSGTYLWQVTDRKVDFTQTSTIANRGIEGDITVKIFDRKNLQWSVSVNGAYNVNQMLEVAAADADGRTVGAGLVPNVNARGRAAGSFFGYRTDAEGNRLDINGNGKIDIYDQVILGNPIPKFNGGLSTSFRYKNLSAEIMTDGAFGFDILNLNALLVSDSSDYVSDKFVEKGDYFRIGRVSVGYDVPFRSKCFIKGLKLTASMFNLCTISKYSGWNPDVNCFGTSALAPGIDYGSYPAARSFVLGVGLKF